MMYKLFECTDCCDEVTNKPARYYLSLYSNISNILNWIESEGYHHCDIQLRDNVLVIKHFDQIQHGVWHEIEGREPKQ